METRVPEVSLLPSRRREAATMFPLLSLAGVVAGTAAALAAIPVQIDTADALVVPALLLACGLAFGPSAVSLRNPRAIFRIQNIIGLAPIFWLLLEPLQAQWGADSASATEVQTAIFCIGAFTAAFWVANLLKPTLPPRWLDELLKVEVPTNALFVMAIVAFSLAFLRFAIPVDFDISQMIYYLGEMRWAAPWSRGDLGGWDAFLDHASYFGFLLPPMFAVLLVRLGWADIRTIVTLVFAAVIAAFLAQGGGRRIVGVLVLSGLLVYAIAQPRIRLRHLAAALVVVAGLMAVTQYMLEIRTAGLSSALEGGLDAGTRQVDYYHVDSNLWAFSQLTALIPNESPYVYTDYLVWVLSRPIPRVLWPGKPLDFGFNLPEALGLRGLSLSVTLIGELYAAGGIVAVAAGGLIYGRIAAFVGSMLSRAPTATRIVSYGVASLALFAGMRSGIEFVLMLYPALAWILLLLIATAFARGHTFSTP